MPRGKAIMVQGTGSHVGKSVLATALCRILRQDGHHVAPFKAQNMSNNAAVCLDGGEIGRAQAEQAAACGLEPTTAMNPILLKPCSDVGSQVVVMGRATGTMNAKEYQAHKMSLLPQVRGAIESLLAEYEVVVIEGAGSPVEVNLKQHDLVNMRTAELADAAVLLVGDIDKGGVFAQLVGTWELLDEDERRRVRGLIINKFRGDIDILSPGLEFLQQRLNRPVLGVVPYLRDLRIAQEDTIPEERLTRANEKRQSLRIDVIRHPRIANFNDFDALGDAIRYVSEPPADLPDAIILPGTKSTIADLRHLRERGFEPWLRAAREANVEIVGICGGFQMLGRSVLDPGHAESNEERTEGLGFLDCSTIFQPVKETARVEGVHVESGTAVEGYEIHLGCTQGNPGPRPLFHISRRHGIPAEGYDGVASADGRVWGTYLHGVFDNDGFRQWWLERLAARGREVSVGNALCGVPWPTDGPSTATLRNATEGVPYRNGATHGDRFDALAAAVRKAIDVEQLYRIIRS
ncbi:MAG TPA: cobyric acid synthase [Pirellulales bacterium]|nr:cobyric acid synthase [Pirellulales bacterium]